MPKTGYYCFSAFIVLLCLGWLFHDNSFELLKYQRNYVDSKEYYRIIFGQFIHINTRHFLVNIVAFIIAFLYANQTDLLDDFCLGVAFCLVITGLGIHLFLADINWYAGSSGFLHGVFLILLFKSLRKNFNILTLLIFAGFLAKLLLDYIYGGLTKSEFEFDIIYQAHLIGAISGAIYLSLTYYNISGNIKTRKN